MKKWMVGGTVMVIVGLLLCSIGFALSGGNLQEAGRGGGFEENEYVFDPENITRVIIEEEYADVNLGISPDQKIHITCYENNKNHYTITKSDAWNIVKQTSQDWTDHIMNFQFMAEAKPLTILLPEGTRWDVELDSAFGDVIVTGGAYAGLSLETDYGIMDLSDVSASWLEVSSSKGDLFLERVRVDGPAEADSSFGMLQLIQVEAAGPLEAETDNGDISLEQVNAFSITAASDLGEISLSDTASEGNIDAQTDKGDLVLQQVSAKGGLSFRTDLGNISGSLLGKMSDYSIESSASLGKNNLPPVFREGSIPLNVHTDLGEISITFQEKTEER